MILSLDSFVSLLLLLLSLLQFNLLLDFLQLSVEHVFLIFLQLLSEFDVLLSALVDVLK